MANPGPNLKQKLQYLFDNIMAAGTPAMIGLLALLSLIVILLASILVALFRFPSADGAPLDFGEAAWMSLMRTLDAGTMGGDSGFGLRLVMFFVTIGGVFIVSSLIGVLSSGVEAKLEEMRKGRSLVLENDHTVILGWSPQIFTVISELVEANSNRKRPAIAILAEKDKVEMEDEIRARVPQTKNTRIICRSGQPNDPSDLEMVSPHAARAIIVLPPDEDAPDTFVIKTVLAITNNPNRRAEPYHIVTQIREAANLEIVKMLAKHDEIDALLTGDLIARVTAQTSRQSGLSIVYTELMNFGGDEIYFKEEPSLSGRTYGEALSAYEDSAVIGLFQSAGKSVKLNPPMETRLAPGDQIIAISADDDAIKLSGLNIAPVQENLLRANGKLPAPRAEKILVLGWNLSAPTLLRQLDSYVAAGSSAKIVAAAAFEEEIRACDGISNQTLNFQPGDTTSRTLLDALNAAEYDHVIVLADTSLPVQEADAHTLMTLLHLRDIASRDETPFSIVSEMLDLRNRQLAEITKVDDFIVSDHLISLMMSQISENGLLMGVFADLFDPEGSEIYLKPVSGYVESGQPVSFYTVLEAARRRGETAIGYRITRQHEDAASSYGVITNPKKSALITFAPEDKIIVLAEN
ncbi:MAG: lipoprotein [Anaerolineales bacterium]